MPRHTRFELPQVPLVIQRGVNRDAIVVDDDDRHHFLDLLHDAAREHDLAIHVYVLMGNHMHLLADAQRGQCPIQRHAPLWPSCIVDSEAYPTTVYRYIELNPVRAATTEHAEDYPWSSVRASLGLRTDPMVTPPLSSWVSTAIRSNALRSTGRGNAKA